MQAGWPDWLPAVAYWQRRRGRVRVYFCCCPLPVLLLLAFPALLIHLVRHGRQRLRRHVRPAPRGRRRAVTAGRTIADPGRGVGTSPAKARSAT